MADSIASSAIACMQASIADHRAKDALEEQRKAFAREREEKLGRESFEGMNQLWGRATAQGTKSLPTMGPV